ncbi:hypothetical protein H6P81_016179 [Aristolochia fimbriata]|uniref:Uncharacterized protein n=1 Tax=Aristolochia fimbriata TaxID=158543 RepID=A0AAV7E886_ARIFI|nr:hypothetical protein H6P81_016179 [Aristolochia fimbriata]
MEKESHITFDRLHRFKKTIFVITKVIQIFKPIGVDPQDAFDTGVKLILKDEKCHWSSSPSKSNYSYPGDSKKYFTKKRNICQGCKVELGLCMKTRSSEDPRAEPDPEPERSLLNRRRRENLAMEVQNEEVGAEKTMEHYVTSNPNAPRSTLNQLPTKLKDPGCFTIPCEFENFKFIKVLCDLGASINLMPLSICRKLNLGELKETNIMLQFADRSTKKPNGLIEDVLVRIGKFIYPCDFVVLDTKVDWELLLILGRPFLATAAVLIDVKQGKLTLRLNDEEIMFDIKQATKRPFNSCDDTCYFIDVIDECAKNVQQEIMIKDSLERCLGQSCTKEDDAPLMQQEVEQLEAERNKEAEKGAKIKEHLNLNTNPYLVL